MSKYTLSPDAQRDIQSIREYHRPRRQIAIARKLISIAMKACRYFADNPDLGDPRDDILPALRCGIAGSYLIFYRSISGGIQVSRILHSSRDLTPLMFRDGAG